MAALAGRPTDRPSVGSPTSVATVECMRLCGAFFPEVHLNSEGMAALAATAYTLLDYDCIMPVFSVIQEAAALGCEIDWGNEDSMPVARTQPWQSSDDVAVPDDFLQRAPVRVVLDALRSLKREFGERAVIVGKVMGPWTLAYHMHGVQEFLIKTILEPETVRAFLDRLMEITIIFGRAQIETGADVLCLADHATGDLVSARCYADFLLPVHQVLLNKLGCPTILHICGNTTDRLEHISRAGFAAFHFDSKVQARQAVDIVAGRTALIGNINNSETLLHGSPDDVRAEARQALAAGVSIVGPECAVPLRTPNRNLVAIVEAARDHGPHRFRDSDCDLQAHLS